jgi:hypothetical protein
MSRRSRDLPVTARRKFLKGAALTGAAVLVLPVAGSAQPTANNQAKENAMNSHVTRGIRNGLMVALLAGAAFQQVESASARRFGGESLCRHHRSAEWRRCCHESFRNNPDLRGYARHKDIRDCARGSRDEDEDSDKGGSRRRR